MTSGLSRRQRNSRHGAGVTPPSFRMEWGGRPRRPARQRGRCNRSSDHLLPLRELLSPISAGATQLVGRPGAVTICSRTYMLAGNVVAASSGRYSRAKASGTVSDWESSAIGQGVRQCSFRRVGDPTALDHAAHVLAAVARPQSEVLRDLCVQCQLGHQPLEPRILPFEVLPVNPLVRTPRTLSENFSWRPGPENGGTVAVGRPPRKTISLGILMRRDSAP
jgi:hypothetical protein